MQEQQFIINSEKLRKMKDYLKNGKGVDQYLKRKYEFTDEVLLSSKTKTPGNPVVPILPGIFMRGRSYAELEFKNAQMLFEAYKNLSPEDASDERLWTYLTHTVFWEYMQKRTKIRSGSNEAKGEYILTHWFLEPLSPKTIARNDISRLWWGAYLTYQEGAEDPYALTKQLFSMQDYSRTLIEGVQGRNKNVLHGVLEFVIDNPELFKKRKEAKIRFIMRAVNRTGGYKLLSTVSKEEIKNILKNMKDEIHSVRDEDLSDNG
jgi:hypothetical protein